MKFKFSLQKLMEFRKIKEDLAHKEFIEVQSALKSEEEMLNQMTIQKTEARKLANLYESQGGAKIPHLSQISEYIRGQEIRIKDQQAKVDDLKKLAEAKREILKQASIDFKTINKLREKKWETYKEERNKKEQAELDEYTVLRYRHEK